MADITPIWKFNQCFGEKAVLEDLSDGDVLSAVEFDESGNFLATGDKAGRVVIFEIENPNNCARGNSSLFATSGSVQRSKSTLGKGQSLSSPEYKFQCEFQSHEPEFDYLKSLEIEEKINKIKWCKPSNDSLFLLSTNDKTIKLWKISEKRVKTVSSFNLSPGHLGRPRRTSNAEASVDQPKISKLRVPTVNFTERCITSAPRRVFSNAHAYHVNSIAVNSDGELFLSADDLRINLWNLNISDQSYNIVDIKPANMEELTEVITAADFHPTQCNIFMYSSSKGSIKLADMRDRALCDRQSKVFEEPEVIGNKSFFSEIIASISDVKFTWDGRYIVSRDYLTLKIWDVNMNSRPVQTISIHEHLRSRLCELYEQEYIFDKFEVAVSGDGNNLATGSYNNTFHIFDRYGKTDVCIEASKMENSKTILTNGVTDGEGDDEDDDSNDSSMSTSPMQDEDSRMSTSRSIQQYSNDFIDYKQKALHLAMHPLQPCVAVACVNNLYLYGL